MKIIRRGQLELNFANTGGERAEGCHISTIIQKILYERDAKLRARKNQPMDRATLEMGFTWERVLSNALHQRYLDTGEAAGFRPDPFVWDDVHMSPDWINPESNFPLEEWKSTKKTSKKPFEEHTWYWLPQAIGYAYGLYKTKQIDRPAALFRVWYINDDYDWDAKTSDFQLLKGYREIEVEFSWRECQENWQMLLGYAKRYNLLPHKPQFEGQGELPIGKVDSRASVRRAGRLDRGDESEERSTEKQAVHHLADNGMRAENRDTGNAVRASRRQQREEEPEWKKQLRESARLAIAETAPRKLAGLQQAKPRAAARVVTFPRSKKTSN